METLQYFNQIIFYIKIETIKESNFLSYNN
jgi:hypothetical protein